MNAKSNLPKPTFKSTDAQDELEPDLEASPDEIYQKLILLGAPKISQSEFARLNHGVLGEALQFVAEHVRGRQEVKRARREILRTQEERGKSHIRRPTHSHSNHTSRSDIENHKACSALTAASTTVEVTRKEVESRVKKLESLQHETDAHVNELTTKRKVQLLLDVLEKREQSRIKRMDEMSKLIHNLRSSVGSGPIVEPLAGVAKSSDSETLLPSGLNEGQTHHTVDTLSKLHAHNIRLAHLSKEAQTLPQEREEELTDRLRKVIAHNGGLDDPDVTLKTHLANARIRAKRVTRYGSLRTHNPSIGKIQLNDMFEINKSKQNEIQTILDRSAALAFVSEQHIKIITTFQQQTAPTLRSSLTGEDVLRTRGYIDALRSRTMRVVHGNNNKIHPDVALVRQVSAMLRLGNCSDTKTIANEVKSLLSRNYEKELFLSSCCIPEPPPATAEDEALIANYYSNSAKAQERAQKLLSRKSDKAEMGMKIVKDIEELLQEAEMIVGS